MISHIGAIVQCITSRTRYQICCDRSLLKEDVISEKSHFPSPPPARQLQSTSSCHMGRIIQQCTSRILHILCGTIGRDGSLSESDPAATMHLSLRSLSLMISAALLHLSRRARRTHGHRRCMQKRICLVQSCVAGEGHRCQCRQW